MRVAFHFTNHITDVLDWQMDISGKSFEPLSESIDYDMCLTHGSSSAMISSMAN